MGITHPSLPPQRERLHDFLKPQAHISFKQITLKLNKSLVGRQNMKILTLTLLHCIATEKIPTARFVKVNTFKNSTGRKAALWGESRKVVVGGKSKASKCQYLEMEGGEKWIKYIRLCVTNRPFALNILNCSQFPFLCVYTIAYKKKLFIL